MALRDLADTEERDERLGWRVARLDVGQEQCDLRLKTANYQNEAIDGAKKYLKGSSVGLAQHSLMRWILLFVHIAEGLYSWCHFARDKCSMLVVLILSHRRLLRDLTENMPF